MADGLLLKPNWDETMERHKAWWRREHVDGPMMLTWARRSTPVYEALPPPPADTYEERWTSAQHRIDSFEANAVWNHFGGDAFPYLDTNFGPGSYAMFLGSQPGFANDTVWFHKCVDNLTMSPLPEYDPDNEWWQKTVRISEEGMARLKGKTLVSFPDLVEGLDILSSLAGGTETLLALIDTPRAVHKWMARLNELYIEYYDRLADIIRDEWGGTCFSAFSIWGPGKTAKLQCDFSAMISPRQFEEFVAPYLAAQAKRLDNTIYHLDGPECICHVDCLLSIPELRAIQWTPGAGKESLGDRRWYPLYDKIIRGGKALVLLWLSYSEAKELAQEFGPESFYFGCGCMTPEEADDLALQSRSWRRK